MTDIITPHAPYTDPDGYPSWQPDAGVRAVDAAARRHRMAVDIEKTKTRLLELEDLAKKTREQLFELIDEQSAYTRAAAEYAASITYGDN